MTSQHSYWNTDISHSSRSCTDNDYGLCKYNILITLQLHDIFRFRVEQCLFWSSRNSTFNTQAVQPKPSNPSPRTQTPLTNTSRSVLGCSNSQKKTFSLHHHSGQTVEISSQFLIHHHYAINACMLVGLLTQNTNSLLRRFRDGERWRYHLLFIECSWWE